MLTFKSNIDEVCDWLHKLVEGFDFTVPGEDQSLGRDIVVEVASNIADRAADGRGADDSGVEVVWLANSDDPPGKGYASQKAQDYGVFDQPNIRTGQMCSLLSLVGRPIIEPKRITMVYGTGDPPSTSAAPTGYLSPDDRKITDVEKAQFAHEQDAERPERPFYALTEEDDEAVIDLAGRVLDRCIEEANGSP